MENDTPETNRVCDIVRNEHEDVAYLGIRLFAQKLEVERNNLRRERNDLKEALIQILENCYADVSIYSSDELADIYSEIANIARKALK